MNIKEANINGNKYSFSELLNLVKSLYAKNLVTGLEQSEAKLEATKINIQRFERIYKTTVLEENLSNAIKNIKNSQAWYLIVEGWCGDCAQIVPVIAKIAEESNNIELKILLRDENSEFMDAYLTNGGRSVPKLISYDKRSGEEIYQWGPRPQKIQEMVKNFKKENPTVSHDEFVKNVHTWYSQDRTQSIQNDFLNIFTKTTI
jgi:thiol-disulfide isomerase/thioredoxin